MSDTTDTMPDVLIPAIRQYQHNIPDGEFVSGFDRDETIKAFKELQAQLDEANAAITKAVRDLYARDTVNAYERLNRAAQEVKG